MAKLYVKKFKGVNTDKLPMNIGKEELAFCLNMDLNNDGSLYQRKGSSLVTSMSNKVSLLKFDEIRDGNVNELMVAIEGTNLSIYDDATSAFVNKYSSLETYNEKWAGDGYVGDFVFSNGKFTYRLYYDSSTSDYEVEILSYDYVNDGTSQTVNIAINDIVYNNDGNAVNGSDQTYYKAKTVQSGIDLSTEDFSNTTNWDEVGTRPIVPAGLLWEQFDNRLFCAGDDTENLYWSSQGDGTSWDALDFLALGAKPTALRAVGEFLFVGTDRGLIKISITGVSTAPYEITWLTKDGVLNNSLVEVSSGLVGCLTDTGRYLIFDQYTKDGSQINLQVGLPIRNMILDIDDSKMQVLKYKNQVIYTCAIDNEYISNSGSNNNTQFVLNNIIYGWTFYDMPIKNIIEYNDNIYYSNFAGQVLKLSSSVYTDNNNEFDAYAITSIFDFDTPELHKSFRRVFINSNSETTVTIRCYWNTYYNIAFSTDRDEDDSIYGSGASWQTTTYGEYVVGGVYAQIATFRIDAMGKGLQLKITRTTNNADLKIQDLTIEYFKGYTQGSIDLDTATVQLTADDSITYDGSSYISSGFDTVNGGGIA